MNIIHVSIKFSFSLRNSDLIDMHDTYIKSFENVTCPAL